MHKLIALCDCWISCIGRGVAEDNIERTCFGSINVEVKICVKSFKNFDGIIFGTSSKTDFWSLMDCNRVPGRLLILIVEIDHISKTISNMGKSIIPQTSCIQRERISKSNRMCLRKSIIQVLNDMLTCLSVNKRRNEGFRRNAIDIDYTRMTIDILNILEMQRR